MYNDLVNRYNRYRISTDAYAILLVKKYLKESKGYWIDITCAINYPQSEDAMHFKRVDGALFVKKNHPIYPSKADFFTSNGRFDEARYYQIIRALTWEAANKDIQQQKKRGVRPIKFSIEGLCYDKNQHNKSYFSQNAPTAIKALEKNLQDRTDPLWHDALKYINSPEFVYEIRSAKILR